MSIKHVDKLYIRDLLTKYWKNKLNTNKDPANGKWYETGAEQDGGLYGNVNDADEVKIILHEDKARLTLDQVSIIHTDLDNSQSSIPTEISAEISHTFTESHTKTTSDSHTIKFGAGYEVSAKATVGIVESSTTYKFSFEYQYSSTTTESTTTSASRTIKQTVKNTVPAGKIYRATLVCTSQKAEIPFTAVIGFTGTTGTWFKDRVDGHYHWFDNIGTAFKAINSKKLAGADSDKFTENGIETKGKFSNSQEVDFKIVITDITDQTKNNLVKLDVSDHIVAVVDL